MGREGAKVMEQRRRYGNETGGGAMVRRQGRGYGKGTVMGL